MTGRNTWMPFVPSTAQALGRIEKYKYYKCDMYVFIIPAIWGYYYTHFINKTTEA